MKVLWFDMDGTFVDLYGVDDWMRKLNTGDPTPYEEAAPLVNMQVFARTLNRLQREGYKICVVTCLARGADEEYAREVKEAKQKWLRKHLKSVKFDKIDFLDYEEPKSKGRRGILFDDEERHRDNWHGIAINASEMLKVLRAL